MSAFTRGSILTDHDLIAATDTSRVRQYEDQGRRVYTATFVTGRHASEADGSIRTVTFAVGHAEAARVYAHEYAARILGAGWHVAGVRWAR